MNLSDLFALGAARNPDKVALEYRAGGEYSDTLLVRLTHARLAVAAERMAALFHARGLRHGDRMAIFMGNRPEFVIAVLAALRLGAITVPINLAYRRREIGQILEDAQPRLLITEAASEAVLKELEPSERAGGHGPHGPHGPVAVLLAEELAGPADPAATLLRPPRVEGEDLAFLLYTSGTTGRSKGAMLSHDAVLATVAGLHLAWGWSPADTLYLTLPLFHTHGLMVGLLAALGAGATVLLRRKFDAGEACAELESGLPTLFFGVPTMYSRLLGALAERRSARWPGVRLCCSGSAPLSPETFAAFEQRTGHAILERYGMTETGMLLSNPLVGQRRPGTVGRPLPGVSARVVDGAGAELPDGENGELVVRGANLFSGYWRAPEKTAASFLTDADGRRWFRTGDLARRDAADGYVTLLGRAHDLIISGGFNIYPREIEEVLETCPGVLEAAVVGRPHPEWGEIPVAFLVVARPVLPDDLAAHCRAQLAGFKCPREFHFVAQLPRNALGKVQKHLLAPAG